MKYIKLHLTESRTKDNRFVQASIRSIEDNTGENFTSSHPKLLQDIICHALSLAHASDKGNLFFPMFARLERICKNIYSKI